MRSACVNVLAMKRPRSGKGLVRIVTERRASFAVILLVASPAVAAGAGDGVLPEAANERAPRVPADSAEPPQLDGFVEAIYPAEALATRTEGDVLLLLVVSAEGDVASAEVLEGPGSGVEDAALEAVRRFRFRPARRNGQPTAARIRYVYEFRLPPSVEEAPTVVPPEVPPSPEEPTPVERERTDPGKDPALPVAVTVVGERGAARQRHSANAVTVVDLTRAKRESADAGEVLARTEGVNVQRVGGLGSRARFSLAGFDDHQVRFFVDGIPLEYSGYPFGIQNVPLTFAERIDIYKGVVPARLGADSLGGAFELVTDRSTRGTKGALSLQGGSFGTYRLAASGRHLDEKTGLFGKAEAFYDVAANDYEIDVEVPDNSGKSVITRVHRSHDAYEAVGGNVEAGIVNRPWARRLLLRAFATEYSKELQHDVRMNKPYGAVTYGGHSFGGSLRYENDFGRGLSGSLVSGYVFDQTDFLDHPPCVYDWYGRCVVTPLRPRGEVGTRPSDRSLWDHSVFLRGNLSWEFRPNHALRYAVAPTFFSRKGEERLQASPDAVDPLRARRDIFKWINGIEYEANLFDGKLQNLAFGKAYVQISQSEEPLAGGILVNRDVQRAFFGGGDALRYRLLDGLFAKVSYEYAIRLPEPTELFGNGVQIIDNLLLSPERSHNGNLSLLAEGLETGVGCFGGSLTGFYRGAENLIVLLGRQDVFRFENVFSARSLGVEGTLSWTAPGDRVALGANATYQDLRNASDEGTFGQFAGNRIPNKPYFVANAHLRLQERGLMGEKDELSLTWYSRYTHEFFLGWESVGVRELKSTTPAQLLHSVVLSYVVSATMPEELSFSLEAQNLTDEKSFDFFGVQRPGRAFFAKTAATF